MEEKPLTKKQLEQLGFTVTEKELKTKTKVEIEYGHFWVSNVYIDTFYHYPSFQEIVDDIIRKVRVCEREAIKQKITNNLFQ